MYFAIRVVVACAILVAVYLTRGFGTHLAAFAIAFGAALAGQAAALAVKLAAGDQPRSTRALALVAAAVVAAAASILFGVLGA